MILSITQKQCGVCGDLVIVVSDTEPGNTNFVLMEEWLEHLRDCMKKRGS